MRRWACDYFEKIANIIVIAIICLIVESDSLLFLLCGNTIHASHGNVLYHRNVENGRKKEVHWGTQYAWFISYKSIKMIMLLLVSGWKNNIVVRYLSWLAQSLNRFVCHFVCILSFSANLIHFHYCFFFTSTNWISNRETI